MIHGNNRARDTSVVVEEGQATEKWRTPAQPGSVGESSENIDYTNVFLTENFY